MDFIANLLDHETLLFGIPMFDITMGLVWVGLSAAVFKYIEYFGVVDAPWLNALMIAAVPIVIMYVTKAISNGGQNNSAE